ncbi:MAG: hypothetical protein NTY07_10995 [Bacteroidia bacterium]|nr:hypothetical protein [Bacteroidia bacterium]
MRDIFGINNYRFGVETFLMMYLDKYQFVLGSDLENYSKSQELFSENYPCNIYFVLRRPKVIVVPDSIKVSGKKVSFKLRFDLKEKAIEVNLKCEFRNASSKIDYYTEYPYNKIAFKDQKKLLLVARPSTLIDSDIVKDNIDSEYLDYEILYIGQAFGSDGKRTAIDRLASHETVQKIYAQTLTDFPDSDIWVILTKFSKQTMLFTAGKDLIKVNDKDKEIEESKLKHVFDNNGISITDKQEINITEAALIKYFEPQYNILFKDNFPSSKHKSYSECYNLDVRAISIELDMSEMIRKIFTKKIERKANHLKIYEFKAEKDRISLLEIEKNCG